MRRVFVGISAAQLFHSDFSNLLKKLKIGAEQREMTVKWTPSENYHLTLHFFGNRTDAEVENIRSVLNSVAAQFSPFHLKMEDVSAFPSEASGRVIYVGVQDKKIIHSIQNLLSENLAQRNIATDDEEKEFSPHITIARLRSFQHVKDWISPMKRKNFGKIEVKELVLFESQLQGHFPVYVPIERFQLSAFSDAST